MKKFLIVLLAGSCGLAGAQTNAPVQKPKPPPTEINSDSADFDLNSRRAIYHGHVEVIDPKIKLKSELLVVDLPSSGGKLSHVSAETNVVIDFTDEKGATYHVTSDKAVYAYSVVNAVTNETVTFTGNPLVESAEGTISSEPLVWDRAGSHFRFKNYKMVLPHNLSGGGTNVSPIKLF